MKISVCVVLFHTEFELVQRCLASVRSSTLTSDTELEIIVVDNSTDDKLRAPFHHLANRWIHSGDNVGFGIASNTAVKAASGDLVLFLNPDAEISPNALSELASLINATNEKRLLCGWLISDGQVQVDAMMHWWSSTGRLIRRRLYRKYLADAASLPLVQIQKASGGALFGNRSDLIGLGPFDERFFLYGEDADLSVRAQSKGFKLYGVPSAVVQHIGASSQASHSVLVEQARTDAAIRLTSYHLPRLLSILCRLDLAVITAFGLVPGLGRSSGNKAARTARFSELRRWSIARDRPVFHP